jgi:hypothetical protein
MRSQLCAKIKVRTGLPKKDQTAKKTACLIRHAADDSISARLLMDLAHGDLPPRSQNYASKARKTGQQQVHQRSPTLGNSCALAALIVVAAVAPIVVFVFLVVAEKIVAGGEHEG